MMFSQGLLHSFDQHRYNRNGKYAWLTLADAKSCLSLLTELGAIVRWVYFRPSIRTMTPAREVSEDEALLEQLRCLREDQILINRRLPILLKSLKVTPPPQLPIEVHADVGTDLQAIVKSELRRLREACGETIAVLYDEVFRRGELPPGWIVDEGWPETPITSMRELADHVESVSGYIETTQDEGVRIVKQALINARVASVYWGRVCIPDSIVDGLPKGEEYVFGMEPENKLGMEIEVKLGGNEPLDRDAVRALYEEIGMELFVQSFSEEDCERVREAVIQVMWIVRNAQADDELAAFENANPSGKEIKMEKALAYIRERGRVSRRDLAEHIDVEESSLQKNYVPGLKDRGVVRDNSGGYRFPGNT